MRFLIFFAAGLVPSLLFAAAKKPEGPEVLVVSDVRSKEASALRPTKEQPIHFIVLGGAERTLGDSIAGEPMPDRAVLTREIEAALGSQGFTRTQLGGPIPQIAIMFTYGSANLSTAEINDTDPATGETSTSTITFNRREIAALVGAFQAERSLMMSSEAERINEAARDDRLYIFVAAFDVAALRKKEKKVLWSTRISIPSRRRTLPESMQVMLASAAPYFATETDLPKFIEDADRRKADVRIGTPIIVEEPPAKKKP